MGKQMFEIKVVNNEYGTQILAVFKHGIVLIGSAKSLREAETQASLWIDSNSDWAAKQLLEGES